MPRYQCRVIGTEAIVEQFEAAGLAAVHVRVNAQIDQTASDRRLRLTPPVARVDAPANRGT